MAEGDVAPAGFDPSADPVAAAAMTDIAGVVAAPRLEAIRAGEAALQAGGNAVDAAVSASAVLGVVEPYMTGPGAVGEIVYMDAAGACHVIDGAGHAPLAAAADMFRIVGPPIGQYYPWPEVDRQSNTIGALSVAAPRFIAALYALHARFGRLPWERLLAPAIDLAQAGFGIDFFSAAVFAHEMSQLQSDPEGRALFYPDGVPLPPPIDTPPALFRNVRLAETYQAIADAGPRAMSEGRIAKAMIQSVAAGGGILAAADLAAAENGTTVLEDVAPLAHYRGYRIYASPRPSGGVTAAQILGILDRLPQGQGSPTAPARYERFALASTHAFADRLARLSGSTAAATVSELLSPENLDAGAAAVVAGQRAQPANGAGHHPATATTCLTVVDRDGAVIALTQTLLSFFGSHLGVSGAGFHLNNGMLWFDPRPGLPNSIAPGKRALAAVSPLIAISADGKRRVAVAGLGARRIISAIPQALENYVDYGLPLQRSIDVPRIHTDTNDTLVDERLPPRVFGSLRRLGLDPALASYSPTSTGIARLTAVEFDAQRQSMRGAIDSRSSSIWRFGR